MDETKGGVQVVEQACDVLFAIAASTEAQSVRELAGRTGISKTTVQRIMVSLHRSGLLTLDDRTQKYALSHRVMEFGASWQQSYDLLTLARPWAEKLHKATKETVAVSVASGGWRVTVFQLESPLALRYSTQIGRPYPLHIGATGRLLLSQLPDEEVERLVSDAACHGVDIPEVGRVQIDAHEVHRDVARIRQDGFALSESWHGAVGSGVAVRLASPDGRPAALSLYGPDSRLTAVRMRELLPDLVHAAEEISRPTLTIQQSSDPA
ncbi:IclR family transcriptional regulator [Actinocatenispora comari]|uniref:Transcriptional regulator n=1 Tax=Actinocatenispora comari TaxID=2807577 RepID=A0A8J4A5N1_9ACTN|nr:IclR family transcriptional regulator [Actinocatenispora comari]GIL25336.1 transcriptional regulator [Actinocatenispora comari]